MRPMVGFVAGIAFGALATAMGAGGLGVPASAGPKATGAESGDHEPHHATVLLAGARKLGESIEKWEYSLRRRRP